MWNPIDAGIFTLYSLSAMFLAVAYHLIRWGKLP